jgi:cation:H+ antiporter
VAVIVDGATVVAGLVLLTVAADRLVLAAARLARAFGLSPILIGAVVVGLGTSLPEMLVSGLAAGRPGGLDLAMGNIVGSNVANLALVLGLSVVISPITQLRPVLKREGAVVLVATLLVTAFAWDAVLSRWEGIALLIALPVALSLLVRWSRDADPVVTAEVDEMIDGDVRPGKEIGFGVASLAVTLLGAQLLVTGAQAIAQDLGVSEAMIGLTLVAVGTSLPELATAVAAARRRENDIVLGNVLGSNMFNALAVGGVAGIVGNGAFDTPFTGPLLAMLAVTLLAGVLATAGEDRLARSEGVILLVTYPIMLTLI